MANILDELKDALSSFESSVKKDLEEMREQKREVLRLRNELYDTVKNVNYVRHDGTVIVSAPNIILGNVDQHGNLIAGGGGSSVTIRANNVAIEGVGDSSAGGSITQRAASIRSIAVDPGVDGLENVVCGRSEIVCQAKGIERQAANEEGTFVSHAGTTNGIRLHSDTSLDIHATPSNEIKTSAIEGQMKDLDNIANDLKSQMSSTKKSVESAIKDITKLLEQQEDLNDTEIHLRASQPDISEMHNEYVALEAMLLSAVNEHIGIISRLAETERRKEALKAMKDQLKGDKSNYTDTSTEAYVSIRSESMSLEAIDGDGNIRENQGAGLYVQSPHINIVAHDKDGALIKDSDLNINTQKVGISTENYKYDEKREKADITSVGDVTIVSKTLSVKAIDSELKDNKIEEKALTKDSKFSFRAENISAEATDTEGKSTGNISLNAKDIKVAAMNVDKEKRTDKELATTSQMVLLAENMFVGSSDKNTKSKLVQVASDKVGVMATTTAEMQQGEAKAVVTLDGGNLTVGSGKNELNGDTTINGKVDIKGETSAPSGKFDILQAGKSFKSPNISDGMGAPSAAQAGKPAAKLQEEEAKKEKNEE